jgi:hypothetical protein
MAAAAIGALRRLRDNGAVPSSGSIAGTPGMPGMKFGVGGTSIMPESCC